MRGSISYSWYCGRKIIFFKVIFQGLIAAVGAAFNIIFNAMLDSEAYMKINTIIYMLILLFTMDVYMQLYDKQQKMKVDRYMAATPLGFKKYNDGILLFDGLFLIYSFCFGAVYVFFMNMIACPKSNIIHWKYLMDIFAFYMIVKIIFAIIMNVLIDIKSVVIFIMILFAIGKKYFTKIENVLYIKQENVSVYYIVLILLLLYMLLRNLFEKLWKRKS